MVYKGLKKLCIFRNDIFLNKAKEEDEIYDGPLTEQSVINTIEIVQKIELKIQGYKKALIISPNTIASQQSTKIFRAFSKIKTITDDLLYSDDRQNPNLAKIKDLIYRTVDEKGIDVLILVCSYEIAMDIGNFLVATEFRKQLQHMFNISPGQCEIIDFTKIIDNKIKNELITLDD